MDSDEASPDVWCSAPAWPQQTPAKGMSDTWFLTCKRANGVKAWAWQDAVWNGRPLIVLSSNDARQEER